MLGALLFLTAVALLFVPARPRAWHGLAAGGVAGAAYLKRYVYTLRLWETRYNIERFSMALRGQTSAEKLAAVLGVAA
jgi:hypothetical protein